MIDVLSLLLGAASLVMKILACLALLVIVCATALFFLAYVRVAARRSPGSKNRVNLRGAAS